jgi:hypothetical protein
MSWTSGAILSMLILVAGMGVTGTAQRMRTAEPAELDDSSPRLVQATEEHRLVLAGHAPGHPAFEGTQVFSVRPDGSALVQLTADPGWQSAPVWSADRTRIAFTRWRGRDFAIRVVLSDQDRTDQDGNHGRHVIRTEAIGTDRTEARRLATQERDDVFFWFSDSPDPSFLSSAWLAFGRELISGPTSDAGEHPFAVYLVQADGATALWLTGDPSLEIFGAWSPDGTRIGFTVIQEGRADVMVMRADGSDVRRLSDGSSEDHWLGWSPDGQRIAIRSVLAGKQTLRVVDADGRAEGDAAREIMATACDGPFGFAWALDSRRLAFTRGCSQPAEFWIAAIDGGAPIRLSEAIRVGLDWYRGSAPLLWGPEGVRGSGP